MTVLMCGRTNLGDRAEEITRVLREEQGFRTDGGCGRLYDLDNPISHMRIYRCLECARWLCRPCMVAHFEESDHAYQVTSELTTQARPARPARLEAQIRPQLEVHACPARGWRPPVNAPDSHLMNRGDQCIGPETSRESVTAEQSFISCAGPEIVNTQTFCGASGSAGSRTAPHTDERAVDEAGSSVSPRAAINEGRDMDADLIEGLAEAVHNGWMAEKRAQGYAGHVLERCDSGFWSGECGYPNERHHPDMLPYADLAENVREYDRATVRAVLRALDAAGLQIVQATSYATRIDEAGQRG